MALGDRFVAATAPETPASQTRGQVSEAEPIAELALLIPMLRSLERGQSTKCAYLL